MNRLQLLREAFAILKRNPVLWSVPLLVLAIETVANWLVLLAPPETAILRMLLAFVLAAFLTGALIAMVHAIAEGQPLTLLSGLQAGLSRLLPLLALNLILFVPVWIAIVLLSGSIVAIFGTGLGQPGALQATDVLNVLVSLLGAAGLVIALTAVMNLIGIGAERALVQEDAALPVALRTGWHLFRSELRDYFSIAMLLIGVVLALGLAFAFILGPLLSGLATGFSQTPETAPPPALLSPVNIIFILISLVVNSLFTAFASTVWTLAYRQWRGEQEA